MNIEVNLDWERGTPKLTGLYFVAIQYGVGAGVFDFIEWNGNSWAIENNGEVVAFIDIQSFMKQFSIKWPSVATQPFSKSKPASYEGEPWEEV